MFSPSLTPLPKILNKIPENFKLIAASLSKSYEENPYAIIDCGFYHSADSEIENRLEEVENDYGDTYVKYGAESERRRLSRG